MKAYFTKLLLFLMASALPAAAQIKLAYVTNNGAITITGYARTYFPSVATIPSETNGYPVTSIADSAFAMCDTLSGITIPNSITNVGTKAFYGCSILKSITIPDSVTSLGTNVFYNCQGLTNVTLGTNVTSIEPEMFVSCNNLYRIVIPDSVTNLADRAFDSCSSLTNVTLGNGLRSIGRAFVPYIYLKSLTLGTNLTTIGDRAFDGVFSGIGLNNLTLPDSVSWIGSNAFANCSLRSVTIGNGAIALGPRAFASCSLLTNVTFGSNVLSLGPSAFSGCGFTRLTIPGCITNLGDHAFASCLSLTSVTIGTDAAAGSSATRIGDYAFYNDYYLASVTFGSNVTSIGREAFSGCRALTTVTLPASVTNLGSFAFRIGTLQAVTFLGNAPSDDGTAFYGNNPSGLYYLPNTTGWGPTYDGLPAFLRSPPFVYQQTNGTLSLKYYTGLYGTAATIPSVIGGLPVTSIENFDDDCLTTLTIPSSVTNVSWFTCVHLKGLYFEGNAPTVSQFFTTGRIYYLPQTTGWSSTFYGFPTAVWTPQIQTADGSFGFRTNQFGFNINWASDQVVVVEANTDLANPTWTAVSTNTLSGGSAYFSDPQWTNHPTRLYRLRSL